MVVTGIAGPIPGLAHDSDKLTSKVHEDPAEDEATEFAANTLIPPRCAAAYRKLLAKPMQFTRIEDFAREVGIAPGIVVGRLQHDGALDWKYGNNLKRPVARA